MRILKISTEFAKIGTRNTFHIRRFAKINTPNLFVEQGFSMKKLNLNSSYFLPHFYGKTHNSNLQVFSVTQLVFFLCRIIWSEKHFSEEWNLHNNRISYRNIECGKISTHKMEQNIIHKKTSISKKFIKTWLARLVSRFVCNTKVKNLVSNHQVNKQKIIYHQ